MKIRFAGRPGNQTRVLAKELAFRGHEILGQGADAEVEVTTSFEEAEVHSVLGGSASLKVFLDIDRVIHADEPDALPDWMRGFDLYLAAAPERLLAEFEAEQGIRRARTLYASFDPRAFYFQDMPSFWDLGASAEHDFLVETAKLWPEGRFVIAQNGGPVASRIPGSALGFPKNIQRIPFPSPEERCGFFNQQRFHLSSDLCPTASFFEAAACGTPLITPYWRGLEHFLEIGSEVLIADSADQVVAFLTELPEERRLEISSRARSRFLRHHSSPQRAGEFERYLQESIDQGDSR